MLPTAVSNDPLAGVAMFRDQFVRAYKFMLHARLLDDRLASLYRAGKIFGGVFLGRGQEALSAGLGVCLKPGDVFAPLIRDAAGRLAFGEPMLDSIRTYLGSPLGSMRGRDGNIHRGRPKEGLLPMISHLGAMISVVNGMLLARRMQKRLGDSVGAACIGEGGTSTGAFHEAINQAGVERLPLVMVVANNQYAYSTPAARQFACKNLVDRAVGYGFEGHTVDGTDLGECLETLQKAVDNARSGRGPQMIVAKLLRLCGHGEHDDASYIDPKLKQSELGRDCLDVAEQRLLGEGWLSDEEIRRTRAELTVAIEETLSTVQRESAPNSANESWQALSTPGLRDSSCGTEPA